MRTTIHLPDDLLAEVKRLAAKRNTTFTAIVNDALREVLSRHRASADTPRPTRLATFGGTGLRAGVDLDDTAALADLMEGGGAAD